MTSGSDAADTPYPLQQIDFRRLVYRWFAPNYYSQDWARAILAHYWECEDVLSRFLEMKPARLWINKNRVLMDVFHSMRQEGMINPLIVKPVVFPTIAHKRDKELFTRYDVPVDHVVVVGNQRLSVLRAFWSYGWLKSPMVGCRVALPGDRIIDDTPALRRHPYKVKKHNRWVPRR